MSNANTSRLVNLSLLARYRHFIPFLFLVLMVFFSWRELSQLDWKALRSGIQDIPFFTLILLQLFGFIAVLLMTLYDWLLCRWLGITLPINKLTRFSWVANTFNNFIGLSGLAGSGIRYLLLSREGVPAKDGIIYSGTLMLSIPVGLAALAWVVLFKGQEYLTKIALPSWLTYTAVVLFAAYLGLFFLLTGKGPLQTRFNNTLASLNLFQRLQLIGVSLLDWTIAGVVAWACLWVSNAQTPVIVFLTAFVTANAFGVFSLVPGGLGVFDSTLLLALSDQGISSAAVLAGIVLYRLVLHCSLDRGCLSRRRLITMARRKPVAAVCQAVGRKQFNVICSASAWIGFKTGSKNVIGIDLLRRRRLACLRGVSHTDGSFGITSPLCPLNRSGRFTFTVRRHRCRPHRTITGHR